MYVQCKRCGERNHVRRLACSRCKASKNDMRDGAGALRADQSPAASGADAQAPRFSVLGKRHAEAPLVRDGDAATTEEAEGRARTLWRDGDARGGASR